MNRLIVSSSVVVLSLGLLAGVSAPAQADPGPRPTCLGSDGTVHVWNLFTPEDQFFMDSCAASNVVLARNVFGTYSAFAAAALSRLPAGYPLSLLSAAWAIDTSYLAQCAGNGTGILLTQDSSNGTVVSCSAQ